MAENQKVVLITGASSGVGLAASVLFASQPGNKYRVYASLRNPSTAGNLEKAAEDKKVKIEIIQLDVSKEESVNAAITTILSKEGKIDVLINNAGFTFAKPLELTSMSEFREIFDTNLFGVVATSKAVVPSMRASKSGHIINISSYGGLVGQPFNDAYCAAKFAVNGLTESMHSTLVPLGVKVTLVCPGAITTPFVAKAIASASTDTTGSNPYEGLWGAYMDTMKKMFAGNAQSGVKTSQTAEELAEVLLAIVEAEKPHFMYLTSDYIAGVVGQKLKDVTGDTTAEMTIQRSYGGAI